MTGEHLCDDCKRGCTARYTEERTSEEVKGGPYILFAAIIIVVLSLAVKWLL